MKFSRREKKTKKSAAIKISFTILRFLNFFTLSPGHIFSIILQNCSQPVMWNVSSIGHFSKKIKIILQVGSWESCQQANAPIAIYPSPLINICQAFMANKRERNWALYNPQWRCHLIPKTPNLMIPCSIICKRQYSILLANSLEQMSLTKTIYIRKFSKTSLLIEASMEHLNIGYSCFWKILQILGN